MHQKQQLQQQQQQPAVGPRTRNACEACHERKQRCIIPEQGGPCQACQICARRCFFVPRLKAGRPRRVNKMPAPLAALTCVQDSTVALSALRERSDSSSYMYHSDQMLSPLHASDMDVDISTSAPVTTNLVDDLDGLDGYFDPTFAPDARFSSSSPSTTTTQGHTPDSSLLTLPWPAEAPTHQQQHQLVNSPQMASDPLPLLLQRFAELHHLGHALSRETYALPELPHRLRPIISTLDAVCTHALALTDPAAAFGVNAPGLDPARTAVLLGLVFQVLSVCETIVSTCERQLGVIAATAAAAGHEKFSPSTGLITERSPSGRSVLSRNDSVYSMSATTASGNAASYKAAATTSSAATTAAMASTAMAASPGEEGRMQSTRNTEAEMSTILLLKQVDLHLTQTRICLARVLMQRNRGHRRGGSGNAIGLGQSRGWEPGGEDGGGGDWERAEERGAGLYARLRGLIDMAYR